MAISIFIMIGHVIGIMYQRKLFDSARTTHFTFLFVLHHRSSTKWYRAKWYCVSGSWTRHKLMKISNDALVKSSSSVVISFNLHVSRLWSQCNVINDFLKGCYLLPSYHLVRVIVSILFLMIFFCNRARLFITFKKLVCFEQVLGPV